MQEFGKKNHVVLSHFRQEEEREEVKNLASSNIFAPVFKAHLY